MKLTLSLIYIFGISLLGCNYNQLKGTPTDENIQFSMPSDKISELSYAVLAQKVFTPKCISCHGNSGNINLESYGQVLQNLASIKKTVFTDKSMPKNDSLSEDQLSYLWNWIKLGAPEQSQSGTTPVEDPLVATYESINKHVFQTSCATCHNSTGTGQRVLLDKQSLLTSPRELVLPGNPDESGLVLSLERTDDKRMPPASEGFSELKPETISIIREWITNGAKD